jgi:hypothetical protein
MDSPRKAKESDSAKRKADLTKTVKEEEAPVPPTPKEVDEYEITFKDF